MKNSEKSDLYELESDGTFAMKHRRFTNTALPVFSGAECWFQHFHIVQAIVKSNGWPEETAALQLFAHLKGEALNVALLLTREKRESWTGLVSGLSAYYQSPGRLAVLRRQFESAFRRPGLDPATFATELGILAIQGFEDMKEQARDTMIRDKFIAGQRQCALRRQLDGFAQDTPIGEIVDSCRMWESHSESDRVFTVNRESDVGNQPGDSRTRKRRKLVVNGQPKVAETDKQEPMVGSQEDPSVFGLLVNQLLQSTQGEILRRDRPSVVGPVCFSCGDGGHRVNRCPQVNADFPFLPAGWSMNMDNGQYRAKRMNQTLAEEPGNEQRSKREGQPLGPPEIKAPLTQAGVSAEISNGNPTGGFRRKIVSGATGRPIVRSFHPWKRSRGRPEIQRDQPVSVPPKWTGDRRALRRWSPGIWTGGMRPAKDFQSVPQKDSNTRTRGVQKTMVTPLSALAENFIPRKTSRKPPTPQMPTDNELDRSFARTGPKKMETPQDIIEIDIATAGAASPTEIEKPVAVADVARASGPAVTGASGPVVARTRFLSVTDVAGASGPAVTGAGGPVVTGTRFRSVTDVAGAGGPAVTGAGGPVVTGTRFRSVTDVAGAGGPAVTKAGGPVVTGTRFRSVADYHVIVT